MGRRHTPRDRERTRTWLAQNGIKDARAQHFMTVPPIFGTAIRTRVLVSLALNGPGRKQNLFQAASASYTTLYSAITKLERLGIVATHGRSIGHRHFLNPQHPAHDEFAAVARAVDRLWPVPRWEPVEVAPEVLASIPAPVNPPCSLFYMEPMSRTLLFIAATGGANLSEICDMIGYPKVNEVRVSTNRLQRAGLVTYEPRAYPRAPLRAILDRQFFAYNEMQALLHKMLLLHPDIVTLAELMQKYRHNRRYKPSREHPHL